MLNWEKIWKAIEIWYDLRPLVIEKRTIYSNNEGPEFFFRNRMFTKIITGGFNQIYPTLDIPNACNNQNVHKNK